MKKLLSRINPLLLKEAFFCMLFSFFIIGIIALIGINLSFFSPFKNAFKDFSYLDLYYAEKLNEENFDLNENIVLVNIDRLNRKEIAEVLDELKKFKPKVIGLDIIFKDKDDPVWDKFLADQLKDTSLVFAYSILGKRQVTTNSAIHRSIDDMGYSNFNFDTEAAVIRNFQAVKITAKDTLISFPAAIAMKCKSAEWLRENLSYFEMERPIKYSGNRNNFLILEREDIIGQKEISFLKDKIIMIGYLGNSDNHFHDMEDKHYTPMNPKFVGKSPPDTFGLVIHANIVQMLLTSNFIKTVPSIVLLFLTLLFTFFALAYFIYLNKRQLASYILRLNLVQLAFIVIFIYISLLFFKNGILLKVTSITATVVFSMGLIGYYKKLAHYLYKKYKWEGYFYHT